MENEIVCKSRRKLLFKEKKKKNRNNVNIRTVDINSVMDIKDCLVDKVLYNLKNKYFFRFLIDANMFAGKSYAMKEMYRDLLSQAVTKDVVVVFVCPTNFLCYSISKGTHIAVINGEEVEFNIPFQQVFDLEKIPDVNNLKSNIIMTNPSAIGKAVELILKDKKDFLIIFDEAHDMYDSRTKDYKADVYKKYDAIEEMDECRGAIYMSATTDIFIGSKKLINEWFDLYTVGDRKKNYGDLEVVTVDDFSIKTKAKLLESRIDKKSDDTQILYYLNNTKILDELEKRLKNASAKFGLDTTEANKDLVNIESIYRNNSENSEELQNIIKTKTISQDLDALGVTSYANAGIEIYLKGDGEVVIFCEKRSFGLIQETQIIGRIRTIVSKVILIMKKNSSDEAEQKAIKYKTFEEFRNEKYPSYMKTLNSLITLANDDINGGEIFSQIQSALNSRSREDYLNKEDKKTLYNICDAIIEREIDENMLQALTYKKYALSLLDSPECLAHAFYNQKTLEFNNVYISEYTIEKKKKEKKVLTEEEKLAKKERSQEKKQQKEFIEKKCSSYKSQLLSLKKKILEDLFNENDNDKIPEDAVTGYTYLKEHDKKYKYFEQTKKIKTPVPYSIIKKYLEDEITDTDLKLLIDKECSKMCNLRFDENNIAELKKFAKGRRCIVIREFIHKELKIDSTKVRDYNIKKSLGLFYRYAYENKILAKEYYDNKIEYSKDLDGYLLSILSEFLTINKKNQIKNLIQYSNLKVS